MYRSMTEVDGWTLRQLSMRPQNLPSTSVKFLCVRATICQFSVRQRDLPSTSVNLPCAHGTFRKLSLTFYASVGTSVKNPCGSQISLNIRQLYVRQRDIPSTLRSSMGPSVNFHQLLSVHGKHFVRKLDLLLNFRQLSMWLCDLPSTFRASPVPSIKF